MSEQDRNYVRHILDCIERIQEYTAGGKKAFDASHLIQDAVVRNIEIIGEAVKNLSDETKAGYPDIPWKQIARMRDKVIHHYFGLDLELVWGVVEQHIQPLKVAVEDLRGKIEGKGGGGQKKGPSGPTL